MPYKTTYVPPDVFLSSHGVTVFRTYREDDVDAGILSFWFTLASGCSPTQPMCENTTCPHVLDVRTLSTWQPPVRPLSATDAHAWQLYWEAEDAAIRCAVQAAIQAAEITAQGIHSLR